MIKTQPLKFHGGKSYLAKWLHSLAPPSVIDDPANGYTHRNIAFAGGLGEFWNWEPVEGISEAANDCNGELTNFYKVLRSTGGDFVQLKRLLESTPFSDEFVDIANDGAVALVKNIAVDRAWKFFIKYRQSRQGLGKDYATPTTRTRRGMNENVSAWLSAVDGLPECHERLRRVEIRNMDCIAFIKAYDHPRALFYLDPTCLKKTRSSFGEYGPHEMTEEQHKDLLWCLSNIQGKFMLSGYHSYLYDRDAKALNWRCAEKVIDNKASSSKTKEKKTECVWMNYA